jgi:3-oxoacyl-[acyl-carrier protein] reductase
MARTPEYFVGKTIIITGAASGIGAATALIFAREGANIVLADINKEKADEVAAAVKKLGA